MRLFLIAMAVAAAAPAASSAAPASTFGRRRDRRLGGSSFLAAVVIMAATLGATLSCTATLPRSARTAIHTLARPILGLAHSAALPAPRFALTAPRFALVAPRFALFVAVSVIGRAWSASLDACMAILLARLCMSAGTMALFLDITDTALPPP